MYGKVWKRISPEVLPTEEGSEVGVGRHYFVSHHKRMYVLCEPEAHKHIEALLLELSKQICCLIFKA